MSYIFLFSICNIPNFQTIFVLLKYEICSNLTNIWDS